MTLVELMVGIALGLMVVAVAAGALMASRGISGTVSDASQLQQQASFAFRTIGMQVRQAGSLFLNLNPGGNNAASVPLTPVAVEVNAKAMTGGCSTPAACGFTPRQDSILGTNPSSGQTLSLGARRYKEPVFTAAAGAPPQAQVRNCLAAPTNDKNDQRLESVFAFDPAANVLRCSGNGAVPQPIVQNVANFQVRYLLVGGQGTGNPLTMYQANPGAIGANNWNRVTGVEVCMELYGTEVIDMPTGSTYTNCDGNAVNMTTLPAASGRQRRMHMTFRSVFQLRSQGVV